MFDRVKKAADYQNISQAEMVRQSIFFGLSEQNYYYAIEIAKKEGTSISNIIQQSFSLSDAVMNPDMSVSDVLKDRDPHISFADAMKNLSEIQTLLISKVEKDILRRIDMEKQKKAEKG